MIRKAQFMKAYRMPLSAYDELTDLQIETFLIIDKEIHMFKNEQMRKKHG